MANSRTSKYSIKIFTPDGRLPKDMDVAPHHYVIMTHKGGEPHSVVVGRSALTAYLTAAGITLGVLAVAFLGVIIYAWWLPSHSELEGVVSENRRLKLDLARTQERVGLVEQKMMAVRNLEVQLRRLTQVSDPSRRLSMGPLSEDDFAASVTGESQSGRFNEALIMKMQDTFGEVDPEVIVSRVDELVGEVENSETKLAELTAYMRDQKFVLTHTPSIWPARGWMTSAFGVRFNPFTKSRQFHEGIDISNSVGAPVVAPADGVVIRTWDQDGYGRTLIIDHGNGVQTVYAHLSQFFAVAGDKVTRGQKIAAMGNTGRSTGPHLHYEVRIHGIPHNPMTYIIE